MAMKVEMSSPEISKTTNNKTPMIQAEVSAADERERRIRTEINYEDPGSDQDSGDVYGPNSPMTEHDGSEYEAPEHDMQERNVTDYDAHDHGGGNNASTTFFESALQQSGEVQWKEGNASNIMPVAYMSNVSTSLQTKGGEVQWKEGNASNIMPVAYM